MGGPRNIDWEAVEFDYRAGLKSLRKIASENGCTEGSIRKRAKKEEWPRDISAKIKARAEDLVRTAEVRKEVRKTLKPTEKQKLEVTAANIAAIDLSHRSDVSRCREIVNSLIEELQGQIENKELLDDIGEIMAAENAERMNELFSKVTSFGGRTDNMKKLSDTLKTLVELERKIVKLDEDKPISTGNPVNLIITGV